MTWIKLNDNAVDHPKVAGLSDKAFRLWITSLCYASEFLTNGVLPNYFLKTTRQKYRDELLGCGLWERDAEGNISIHDYLVHQCSREYVLEEREIKRRRSAFHRDDQLKDQIRKRDCDRCRYCGHRVSWTDRRGPKGGTYDHIKPRGPETLDNMVVACRLCNNRKGPRTPEEAGMQLCEPGWRPSSYLIQTQNGLGEENREQRTDTENREQRQQTAAPLIMSPAAYEKRKGQCAFVGSRLEVPHSLHSDMRKLLGGVNADAELLAWYEDLNAEIEDSGETISPDVFKWLKARYGQWKAATQNKPIRIQDILDREAAKKARVQ